MVQSVFSESWHNVAGLRPRLLPHARFHRHTYRGQRWYIVHDATSRRYHRISPASYALVARMNGRATIQEIWDGMCAADAESPPTQNEVVDLLAQLHANDLLFCDVTPDAAQLFERYRKQKRSNWKQRFANPLSLRFSLFNPDEFLTRWSSKLAWLFGPLGAALWLVAVLPAVVLAGMNWPALTHNLADQVLSSQNLLLIGALFIPIKVLHELGHGFATKIWGGEVPEIGVMFLVFAPVPYVDSSSSAAFPSKYRRAIVGAAGMLVEVFLAAIALYVWLLVEPGLIRAIAFNVILIAGVSTLVVNGNPLLRFDGYYIFSDLIEIPNLAQRGQRFWRYLSDRHLFRAQSLETPSETPAERAWLCLYTPLSWLYRVFITVSIILFIAGEFFVFGVLIALWSAITLFFMPLWKATVHLRSSPTLHRNRAYAIKVALGLAAGIVFWLAVVPMPLRTQAEGVVWLPDRAVLRAGTDGFFQEWLEKPGKTVQSGTPLSIMNDTQLDAELKTAQARVDEFQARYDAVQFEKPAEADIIAQQLAHAKGQRDHLARSQSKLIVTSESDGVLVVPQAQDMTGRYYHKGELLGYILDGDKLLVRVAVAQEDIDLVRTRLEEVEVRFVERAASSFRITALHEAPGGVLELPSPALGSVGGGKIPTDPQDSTGVKTLQRIFLLNLELPRDAELATVGSRVHVRFAHIHEPLLQQWYRRIRQLFLSRLHV